MTGVRHEIDTANEFGEQIEKLVLTAIFALAALDMVRFLGDDAEDPGGSATTFKDARARQGIDCCINSVTFGFEIGDSLFEMNGENSYSFGLPLMVRSYKPGLVNFSSTYNYFFSDSIKVAMAAAWSAFSLDIPLPCGDLNPAWPLVIRSVICWWVREVVRNDCIPWRSPVAP